MIATMRQILLLFSLLASLLSMPALARDKVVVFAPSSMQEVLDDVGRVFEAQTKQKVIFSYAGTQQLARQLEAGAPADVFITADRVWMDWLIEQDLIGSGGAFALAGNRLVLAVHKEVENWASPDKLLTEDRFAMAEPEAVPSGRYAKQALEKRGVWEKAKHRAVFGDNVRITVRRLARGEVSAAIVYATDAAIEPEVKTLFVFEQNSHQPIDYWAALTVHGQTPQARSFYEFLKNPTTEALFARAGFTAPSQVEN